MARPKERTMTMFPSHGSHQGVERSAAFENRAKQEMDKLRVKVAKALDDDLLSLFEQGDHWDVSVTNGTAEVKAHRCILQARSGHLWQNDWITTETDEQGKEGQQIRLTGHSEKQITDFVRQLYVVSDSALLLEEFLPAFPGFKDGCHVTSCQTHGESDETHHGCESDTLSTEETQVVASALSNANSHLELMGKAENTLERGPFTGGCVKQGDNLVCAGTDEGNVNDAGVESSDNPIESSSDGERKGLVLSSPVSSVSISARVTDLDNGIVMLQKLESISESVVTNCESPESEIDKNFSINVANGTSNSQLILGNGKLCIEPALCDFKTEDGSCMGHRDEETAGFVGNREGPGEADALSGEGVRHVVGLTGNVERVEGSDGNALTQQEQKEGAMMLNDCLISDMKEGSSALPHQGVDGMGETNLVIGHGGKVDEAVGEGLELSGVDLSVVDSDNTKEKSCNRDVGNDATTNTVKSELSEAIRSSYALSVPYETCSCLGRDLLQMYLQQTNCDVCLSVDGVKFLGHKCVLAARSSYFNAMLGGKWCESDMEEIELQGVSAQAVEQLLLFLYGGVMELCTPSDLMELFIVMDMYGVDTLKHVLEFYVRKDLCHFFHKPCSACVASASPALSLCHSFYLEELEERCLKWAVKYFTKIWSNKAFSSLPEAVHQKCVGSVLDTMTENTVLDVIIECSKLSTCLPRIKWTESILYLTTQLMDSAIEYTSSHFIEVIRSPQFLQWGKVASWKASSLEEIFNSAIDSLPIDTACNAYQTLVDLKTAQSNLDDICNQDILDLLDAMVKRCEKFLRTHIHQVARSKQWASVGKALQSKILENSSYIHLDQLPDPKPRPAKRPLPASLVRPRPASAPKAPTRMPLSSSSSPAAAAATSLSSQPTRRPPVTAERNKTTRMRNPSGPLSVSAASSPQVKTRTSSSTQNTRTTSSGNQGQASASGQGQRSTFTSVRNHLSSKKPPSVSKSSSSALSSSLLSSSAPSSSSRSHASPLLSSSSSSSSSSAAAAAHMPTSRLSKGPPTVTKTPQDKTKYTTGSSALLPRSAATKLNKDARINSLKGDNNYNNNNNKERLSSSAPSSRKSVLATNLKKNNSPSSKLPTKTSSSLLSKKQEKRVTGSDKGRQLLNINESCVVLTPSLATSEEVRVVESASSSRFDIENEVSSSSIEVRLPPIPRDEEGVSVRQDDSTTVYGASNSTMRLCHSPRPGSVSMATNYDVTHHERSNDQAGESGSQLKFVVGDDNDDDGDDDKVVRKDDGDKVVRNDDGDDDDKVVRKDDCVNCSVIDNEATLASASQNGQDEKSNDTDDVNDEDSAVRRGDGNDNVSDGGDSGLRVGVKDVHCDCAVNEGVRVPLPSEGGREPAEFSMHSGRETHQVINSQLDTLTTGRSGCNDRAGGAVQSRRDTECVSHIGSENEGVERTGSDGVDVGGAFIRSENEGVERTGSDGVDVGGAFTRSENEGGERTGSDGVDVGGAFTRSDSEGGERTGSDSVDVGGAYTRSDNEGGAYTRSDNGGGANPSEVASDHCDLKNACDSICDKEKNTQTQNQTCERES